MKQIFSDPTRKLELIEPRELCEQIFVVMLACALQRGLHNLISTVLPDTLLV